MAAILITQSGPVVTVSLNRPAVRNALDEALIGELTAWASGPLPRDARVAVLRGEGRTFCAGADLDWMAKAVAYTHEENVRDARRLAAMFHALDALPLPIVGRIHGAALGGGVGLAAVCDVVVAADDTVFGFTEAKLGILPAVIAPFSIAKIGMSAARQLFLTAMRFSAARAREVGLVHVVTPEAGLDTAVDACIKELLTSAPGAVTAAKQLIGLLAGHDRREVEDLTVETIARHRVSPEGQAGMRAFLDRRRAPWAGGE